MSEKKMIATRDGFGKEIVELGKENPNILVVDIDIGKSCKTGEFRKELPGQYINVGIAEQNGAGVAAGLATCGKIPFVVTYAVFGSLRMCEMIRQEICYPNLNVKIACSHGGVTPANDGASHQAIEDMGVLRTIPNMTVIMPADYNSARKLVRQAAEVYGPVYLRFTRDAIPQIYDEDVEFTIGKAHQIQQFFSTLAGLDLVHADKFQRKADVLARRALHEQVELLEDHAHGTPGSAQLALRQTAHVLAFKKDGTARGTFQHVDAADERALAGTALADDTEDVPFVDGKIDALQGKNIRIFAAVTFFQIDDIDDRRFGHSASPLIPLSGVFEVSISSPARKEKRCLKMCCASLSAIVVEERGAEKKAVSCQDRHGDDMGGRRGTCREEAGERTFLPLLPPKC